MRPKSSSASSTAPSSTHPGPPMDIQRPRSTSAGGPLPPMSIAPDIPPLKAAGAPPPHMSIPPPPPPKEGGDPPPPFLGDPPEPLLIVHKPPDRGDPVAH